MRRKLLTGAQEHVLYTLVKLCDEQPRSLKLSLIAYKSRVHWATAQRAVRILGERGIVKLSKKTAHGPDSVWEIGLTNRARLLAINLVLANEHEFLPVP